MKFLVMSDTHGIMGKVYEIIRREMAGDNPPDGIIHLGDNIKDAMEIKKHYDIPVYCVKGNCDGAMNKEDCSEIIETEGGRILLTHGHMDGVGYDISGLMYRGLEEGCIAAFFGHTHIPYLENTGEILLFNPGSLTRPRDGSEGSYGIAEILSENESPLECRIVRYRKDVKPQGGYIRGLINYSDRF